MPHAALPLLALLASVILAVPGIAQTADVAAVELTRDSAERALDAMLEVHDVGKAYEAYMPESDGDDPLRGLAGLALYAEVKAELDRAVAGHGFAAYEEWLTTIQSLLHAYAFARSREAMAEVAPAMREALDRIRNDPNIPDAQKQMLIEQMGAMGSMGATAEAGNAPSPGNQEIALQLAAKIESVSNAMEAK